MYVCCLAKVLLPHFNEYYMKSTRDCSSVTVAVCLHSVYTLYTLHICWLQVIKNCIEAATAWMCVIHVKMLWWVSPLHCIPGKDVLPERQHVREVSVQTVGGEQHPLVIPTHVGVVLGHMGRDMKPSSVEVTLLCKLAVIQITSTHSAEKSTCT